MEDRTITKEINGGKYTIMPLPAKPEGLIVYRKLHGHMLPAMGPIVGALGIEKGELTIKTDDGAMGALQELVTVVGKMMADDEFCRLVDKMMAMVAFNGGALRNEHWDERLEDYDIVVALCVWVNFLRPFFGNATKLQGSAAKLAGMFPHLQTLIPSSPGS